MDFVGSYSCSVGELPFQMAMLEYCLLPLGRVEVSEQPDRYQTRSLNASRICCSVDSTWARSSAYISKSDLFPHARREYSWNRVVILFSSLNWFIATLGNKNAYLQVHGMGKTNWRIGYIHSRVGAKLTLAPQEPHQGCIEYFQVECADLKKNGKMRQNLY